MFKSLIILGTILLGSILMSVSSTTISKNEEGLQIGQKAPLISVEMTGVDGKSSSLTSLTMEKGLVVVFSCNTCPFVVGSDDFEGWEVQYNSLKARAAALGFGFVLINSNEAKRSGDDSLEEMKKRSVEKGYTMPYLVDEKSALANAFGAKTTPHVYVLNQNQELMYSGSIDNKVDSKRKSDELYLLEALSAIANKTAVLTNTTPPRGCSIKRVATK